MKILRDLIIEKHYSTHHFMCGVLMSLCDCYSISSVDLNSEFWLSFLNFGGVSEHLCNVF